MKLQTLWTALLFAVLVAGPACSSASEGAAPDEPPEPTFVRVEGEHLADTFTTASLADLARPVQAGAPWVAVGSITDPDIGESTAAVWSSPDADNWQRTDVPPADPAVSEWFAALVDHPAGRLAVGGIGSGADADAGFWREAGGAWRRVGVPGAEDEGARSATRIASDGERVLVLGYENVEGDGRPLLWFSPDGTEWQAVDGGAGGVFDAEGNEAVTGVASGPAGFVAVGYRDGEARVDGLVWSSPDGIDWQPGELPAPEGATHWSVRSVAAAPGGYAAGGYVTTGGAGARPAVWGAPPGRAWGAPGTPP